MSCLSKAYQEAMDKINKRIDEAIKADGQEKPLVIYSAYEYDEFDNPVDNLDDVPVNGKIVLVDSGDFWDWKHEMDGTENPYKPFRSKIMDSPTWLEIAVEANKMIHTTYNANHCYLEDIREPNDDEEIKPIPPIDDDVYVFVFVMGS